MIEVTDEDVQAVMQVVCEVCMCKCDLKNQDCQCWEWAEPSDIIAAAYEVMRNKHGDTLADAVKEAAKDRCMVGVSTMQSVADPVNARVTVINLDTGQCAGRFISLDDNFPALAAAAVRDLAKQVRQ